MSSKDRTTSVKLDRELRARLYALARLRNRSAHAMMKEAIADYVLREEVAAWQAYLAEHKTVAPGLARHVAELRPPAASGLPEHVARQIADGHNRLRVLRGWRGMTLGRLATALADLGADVGEGRLEAIEEGAFRPGAGLIAALAKALDVKPEDLMG